MTSAFTECIVSCGIFTEEFLLSLLRRFLGVLPTFLESTLLFVLMVSLGVSILSLS